MSKTNNSRFIKLGALLESKNPWLRQEAINTFGQVALKNPQLLTTLLSKLKSPSWEARVASADAIGIIFSNSLKEVTSYEKSQQTTSNYANKLADLNLTFLLNHYKPLLSCKVTSTPPVLRENISKREQRKLIDGHLDLNFKTGVSSHSFISDEEIIISQSNSFSSQIFNEDNKEELQSNPLNLNFDEIVQEAEIGEILQSFLDVLLSELINQHWERRHGAATAMTKLISGIYKSNLKLTEEQVDSIAARILQTLTLDRFNDFVTGSNAVPPVRESAAQALCILLTKCEEHQHLTISVLNHIKVLLHTSSEKLWQCRQTALLFAKYYFTVCSYSDYFVQFFQAVHEAVSDPVDEVVSKAAIALSALFSNPKFERSIKAPLINQVMAKVWEMMQNSQLKEGVDSLLVDLLSIVEIWLKVDDDNCFTQQQFKLMAELIDPRFITRTVNILKCFCSSIKKTFVLQGEDIFYIVKALYRCLLFVRNSEDSTQLMDLVLTTVVQLTALSEENKICERKSLQKCIGYWISCLIYDHKNPEIDVFAHCVDGPLSQPNSPMEMLCGDEIRFLDEEQINERLVERKILAARLLAPILDILYGSEKMIGDQHLHMSIQLLFLPYLRSTSLYRKLGAAIVINCFARVFRQTSAKRQLNNHSLPYPTLLVKEIENSVWMPVKVYDEVTFSVNVLTTECNEFQQYCTRKGVPPEELQNVSQASSMEEVVLATYLACQKKLTKADDFITLKARHNYVLELIKTTKMSIRTNTNRINALLASSLFYFGFLPATITPMIRPLIEVMDSESNLSVMRDICSDSFPILLSATATKTPCPHTKIFKQLCSGLSSCDRLAPKIKQWSLPEHSLTILSGHEDFGCSSSSVVGTKSRNCHFILEKLCDQFGQQLFTVCPELKNFMCLEVEDIENILLNMEVLRVIHNRLGRSLENLELFKELRSGKYSIKFAELLASPNPAVRFRLARFLGDLGSVCTSSMLNCFYFPLSTLLKNIGSDSARCGAVELIYRLSQLQDLGQLISITSLIAPLALEGISDQVEQVRTAAALAFGKLVSLMSLESSKVCLLSGLSNELRDKHQKSLNFNKVLSCPADLPLLKTEEIPGLKPETNLRHYQLEGITWMCFLSKFGLNGVLADDMGLGKTLQLLCLLAVEQEILRKDDQTNHKASLIICPKTLVNHWCNEWRNYFPKRKPLRKLEEKNTVAVQLNTTDCDLVFVISYEEIRTEKKFWELRWNYLILDEGHCIRNSSSQLFKTINFLVSKHRLILSGTPVQNSPADLWALFTFLMPGYLSSKANFHATYMKQIMACRNPKSTEQQTNEGEEALQRLHHRTLPFILRRLKSEVLRELPEKVVQDYNCHLTPLQRQIYAQIVDRCSMKSDEQTEDGGPQFSPLHSLILLRKLVDHPVLVAESLAGIKELRHWSAGDTNYELSGKMVALKELLEECQIGRQPISEEQSSELFDLESLNKPSAHRALIFCQWKSSLQLIADYLESGVFGADINYLRLDGSVVADDRQGVVDHFNRDTSIDLLLLTTHIGGVGLTLTGADVVIFVDHDWNPVKDLQAIDRAHRLGQTKTVNVYRLITLGSVEEKVMSIQKFKTNTADVLVGGPDNHSLSAMAGAELKDLLSFGTREEEAGLLSVGQPPNKRIKKKTADGNALPEEKWSLESLWDSSQYDEQHCLESFKEVCK